jgi:hypothetical protein
MMIVLAVGVFLLGLILGWLLCVVVRKLRVTLHPCRFCNGHGYMLSSGHEASVLDQVHGESANFKP